MRSHGALELAFIPSVGERTVAGDAWADTRTLVGHTGLMLDATGDVAPSAVGLREMFVL